MLYGWGRQVLLRLKLLELSPADILIVCVRLPALGKLRTYNVDISNDA